MVCVVAALAVACLVTASPSLAGARRPGLRTLGDKTLVAWVYIGGLTQRGGSALTLIDDGERFDAIVFGEIAPGRWMAGSDFFRRTQRDQSAYPRETADARTLVQIAIVYRGNRIAIFRNAQPYAAYTVAKPQVFRRDTSVLLGLRYVGHMGEIGFFAGSIEEARIYDVALDASAIAALKPNAPSDPRPIAQWAFEDGTAADSMRTFPPGKLCGGARIADGKLHLNGRDAYMISETSSPASPWMFYKARSKQTGNMWDTWLFHHDGTHYLYYLAKRSGQWDNISMATSADGVHWKERGPILHKAEGVTWMGTGSTWCSPRFEVDGKFQMNFSEWRGPRQTIFFAESADLLHWTRLGAEHEFKQDERWYEKNGRWDCIWTIPRPDGKGLYGYWTATPKAETGGRFGFGTTQDGVHWEALAPPKVHGVGGGEVGAIEKIGGRYYMMFGTGGIMVTLVADKPEGPFHPAKRNFRLLSGHTYFSRFYRTPDGLLANHHSIARNGQVYFGTLKSASLDGEGTLRLAWWQGNEKLKREPVEVKAPEAGEGGAPARMLGNEFDADGGLVLEGAVSLPAGAAAERPGLYLECSTGRGAAILMGRGGVCEMGPISADGSGFKREKRVDRETTFATPARFRLLLKGSLAELYLDNVLIECYSLPEPATGRLGLFTPSTPGAIAGLRAWH